MSSSSTLFQQIVSFTKEIATELQKPKLINIFNFKNKDKQLSLTENYIFIHEVSNLRTPTHYCKLSFEVKFQVIFQNNTSSQRLQIPSALKLQRESCSEQFTFKASHPSIVETWSLELEKKINQRNFHKLFKAKKKIGKGAFATVYLAQRLRDNKLVAVKAFSKEKQYQSDKGKQSLVNEIKLMRNLNHKYIMKLQGVYQTQNSIYVILEYLEGQQLNEFLKENKSLQFHQIKQIMKNILKGLSHLSKHNIIHRDLKPQNIMFKKQADFDLAICDFGLATYADQQKYLFVRCGTPGFVAPEIINIKDLSTKSSPISDIFSAGIIFHYLLFGQSMFQGKKYSQILTQNRLCDFHFNKEIYSKLNFPIYDLLTKMLQIDPSKRVSADEALNHFYFTNQMDIQQIEGRNSNTLRQASNKTKITSSHSGLHKHGTLPKVPKCLRKKENIQYVQISQKEQHYFIFS